MSSDSDSLNSSSSASSNGPDNAVVLQYLNDFRPIRYPTGAALGLGAGRAHQLGQSFLERCRRQRELISLAPRLWRPSDPVRRVPPRSITKSTMATSGSLSSEWRTQTRSPSALTFGNGRRLVVVNRGSENSEREEVEGIESARQTSERLYGSYLRVVCGESGV